MARALTFFHLSQLMRLTLALLHWWRQRPVGRGGFAIPRIGGWADWAIDSKKAAGGVRSHPWNLRISMQMRRASGEALQPELGIILEISTTWETLRTWRSIEFQESQVIIQLNPFNFKSFLWQCNGNAAGGAVFTTCSTQIKLTNFLCQFNRPLNGRS